MSYKDILKKHGIRLFISDVPLDTKGMYVHGANSIFITPNLSEVETNAVISHELQHALSEHELNELNAPSVRLRQEREANEAMADDLVSEYLASCETLPHYVDVDWFISSRKLSSELYVYVDKSFRRILA